MEEINTITLSSRTFFSRLLRSVSDVQDNCCVRKPKYSSNVDGCFDTFKKQNTKRYSSFSGCYNGLQKKTILTIQIFEYFEQIGHFTFVQSAKTPHVRNERLYTQAINVFVKSADHALVGRALGGIGRIYP